MSIILTSQGAGFYDAENAVRELTQLKDTEAVPSSLIIQALQLAENEIAPCLKEEFLNSDDQALLEGKYMLAANFLLRSLASGSGYNQQALKLGSVQTGETNKTQELIELAKVWEQQAWERLARFCQAKSVETNELVSIKNESFSLS